MIFFVKIVANDKVSLYNINKTMQMFLCKFVYTRSEEYVEQTVSGYN